MTVKSQKFNKLRLDPNDNTPQSRGEVRLSSTDDFLRTVVGNYDSYVSTQTYNQGDKVISNGRLYEANEQTTGNDPANSDSWQVIQGELQEIIINKRSQNLENKTIIDPQFNGSVFGLQGNLDTTSETTIPNSLAIKDFVDTNIIGLPNKLSQVNDVNIATEPSENQFLTYNDTSSTWTLNQSSNTLEPSLVAKTSLDNNITVAQDITGFIFNKGSNLSSTYYYTIYRTGGITEFVETGEISIIHYPTSGNLVIAKNNISGDTFVTLSINSTTGQVQYTTTNFDNSGYFCEIEIRLLKDVPLV